MERMLEEKIRKGRNCYKMLRKKLLIMFDCIGVPIVWSSALVRRTKMIRDDNANNV